MNENMPRRDTVPLFTVEATRVRFTGMEEWRLAFFQDHVVFKSPRGDVVARFPDRAGGVSHKFASTFMSGFNFEIKTAGKTLRFRVPDQGIDELKRLAEMADAAKTVPEYSTPVAEAVETETKSGSPESSAPYPPALAATPADNSAGAESDPAGRAATDTTSLRAAMHKELRGWGWGLLGIGVLSIILSGFLDPIWGGILIAMAIPTFFIKHRGMFIVFGTILLLVAVMNIVGGSPGWIAFGLFQLYWGVREFRKFAKYAAVNADPAELAREPAEREPAASRLGVASCALFGATIAIILCSLLGVVLYGAFLGLSGGEMPDKAGSVPLLLATVLVLSCPVLLAVGAGLGLASIFQKRRRRTFGVVGLVLNTILLATIITVAALLPPPPEQGKGGGTETNIEQSSAPAAPHKPI